MHRHLLPLVALFGAAALAIAPAPLAAQDQATVGRCSTPDSVAVRGNSRVTDETIRGDAGLAAGAELNYRIVQRAIKTLYATGQFDDVRVLCDPAADPKGKTTLVITVKERPVVSAVNVVGADRVSAKSVKEQLEIVPGKAVDPSVVARGVARVDSLYQSAGYYLAKVRPETTLANNEMKLTFRVDEGRRLAVSGIRVSGNRAVSSAEIVGAMKTKPEGFWFWKGGGFDDDAFAGDVGERIPELYAKRGFIDFQIDRDTMIVDRVRGKALIDIHVTEGPRYKVGAFEVQGNKRFSSEEVASFYPFTKENSATSALSLGRVTDFLRRKKNQPYDVFDRSRWDEARTKFQTEYANEGYIYASVRPVVDRRVAPDSTHYVDLRWEVDEKTPAIVNRIEIAGNDYTTETCIRSQLLMVPGDVFNQERLIRSYQNISNLGFFESPIPPPDTHTANDQGDVDIVFNVKEKRTGNVNFGASMGQGTGVGGFIGLDQPNLFGECKRGSLQWQFGRYINDFNLTYSDPQIRQSQVSGTVSARRTLSRYNIADLGRSLTTGADVQFGFLPFTNSPFTRVFVSYGGENVNFGTSGLLGQTRSLYGSGFRSTLGFTTTHDVRVGLPFATGGSMQTFTAQFNGGPLGGSTSFQRYTAEARSNVPLAVFGGSGLGSQPMVVTLGLTSRAGVVAGNTGPFFYSQEFALGGVQFGENLRGYDEFSISPRGYITGTSTFNAQRTSFGKAFFKTTAEVGLRLNQALYMDMFYDAGNLYAHARDFDPTRLFRGAGFGVSTVTPLGPLGLDYAYGFDRLDATGHPAPKWQLHFRLGQLF